MRRRSNSNGVLRHGVQFLFWAFLVFALTKALVLPPKMFRIFHWDKAEHFLAFYVLMLLGAIAFPKRSLVAIAVALCAVGAGIEVVQALPFVNRDSDILDWAADTLAIAAVLLPALLLPRRAKF
jgi:hypothetical protein